MSTKNIDNKIVLPENTIVFEKSGVKIITGVDPALAEESMINDQVVNPGDTVITTEGKQLVKNPNGSYTDLSNTGGGGGSGADVNLSNLEAPTEIPVSLLPAVNQAISVGSANLKYASVHTNSVQTDSTVLQTSGLTTLVTSTDPLAIRTSNPVTVRDSSLIEIETGTAAPNSSSGAVLIKTGSGQTLNARSGNIEVTSGPARLDSGDIIISSGTTQQQNTGSVLISTSNAVQSSGDISLSTGSGSSRGSININAEDILLEASVVSIAATVTMNGNTIVEVADPSDAQDVATKNYVDTNGQIAPITKSMPGTITVSLVPVTDFIDFDENLYTSVEGILELNLVGTPSYSALYSVYSVYDTESAIWITNFSIQASPGNLPDGVSLLINEDGILEFETGVTAYDQVIFKFRAITL